MEENTPTGCPTDAEFQDFLDQLKSSEGLGILPDDIEELGRGSFGIAYKYKTWVIKMLNLNNKVAKDSFYKEVETYNRIANIKDLEGYVAPFCWSKVIEDDAKGFIIQKFIDSEPMDVFLPRTRKLSFETGFTMFKHLKRGVERLHKAGFIHRDLKPANILIRTDTKEPILIDFGFACATPCEDTRRVGTPNYMPGNWASAAERLKTGESFRKLPWLTWTRRTPFEKKMEQMGKPWKVGNTVRTIVESRIKPMNVIKAKVIKTQAEKLAPEYSYIPDLYALHLILKQLYRRIDWTGHEYERSVANEYIMKLGKVQAIFLAAQKARGKLDKTPQGAFNSLNTRRRNANRKIAMNPKWNTMAPEEVAKAWKEYEEKKKANEENYDEARNRRNTTAKRARPANA